MSSIKAPPDPSDLPISDEEARKAVRNWFILTGVLFVIVVIALVTLNLFF